MIFMKRRASFGLGYLAEKVKAHGFDRKFRLGYLLRAQSIMEDASDVAALQFARTLDAVGDLPRPGLSSGNIEPWGLTP